MTSDNGFYMYYDKSIITEEEAESLEKLIAACEKNNKVFRYHLQVLKSYISWLSEFWLAHEIVHSPLTGTLFSERSIILVGN